MAKNKPNPIGCVLMLLLLGFAGFMMATDGGRVPLNSPPLPTLIPSATPDDPVLIAKYLADEAIIANVLDVVLNADVPSISVYFDMLDNRVNIALMNAADIVCAFKTSGAFEGYVYLLRARGHFVDSFGNPVYEDGLQMRLNPDTIDLINCDTRQINWSAVADYYKVHRLLSE